MPCSFHGYGLELRRHTVDATALPTQKILPPRHSCVQRPYTEKGSGIIPEICPIIEPEDPFVCFPASNEQ